MAEEVGGDGCGWMPNVVDFQDFLPVMAEKLGGENFMAELCNGFRLLADEAAGAITFGSLKKNAAFLGLQNMTDDELSAMIKEGDFDGDGQLNEREFCILMVRMSPTMMAEAEEWLDQALAEELNDVIGEDQSERFPFLRV
eukprot:c24668_g1_i1 orf=421-843(-)